MKLIKFNTALLVILSTVLFYSCTEDPTEIIQNPVTGSPASAPRNLTAYSEDEKVNLAWDPPAGNGGSFLTSYKVYRTTTPGDSTSYILISSIGIAATLFTDTSAINGTEYFYCVTAVNAAGESIRSTETPVTPAGYPSPPLGLTAIPGNGGITLFWQAPASNGGRPILNYNFRRKDALGNTNVFSIGPSLLSYYDDNLTNDIEYTYSLTAVTSKGHSQSSNVIVAAPAQTLNDPSILYFSSVTVRIPSANSPEITPEGLNLYTGSSTITTNINKDSDLPNTAPAGILAHFRSGSLNMGLETAFLSDIVSSGMIKSQFDTLSRIPVSGSIAPSQFTVSETRVYGPKGQITDPLNNSVFAFYLKGKYETGQNNNIPIFGMLRLDTLTFNGTNYILKLQIKINVAGQNRFY